MIRAPLRFLLFSVVHIELRKVPKGFNRGYDLAVSEGKQSPIRLSYPGFIRNDMDALTVVDDEAQVSNTDLILSF